MKWGTQNLVNESTPARTDTGVLEIGLPSYDLTVSLFLSIHH